MTSSNDPRWKLAAVPEPDAKALAHNAEEMSDEANKLYKSLDELHGAFTHKLYPHAAIIKASGNHKLLAAYNEVEDMLRDAYKLVGSAEIRLFVIASEAKKL